MTAEIKHTSKREKLGELLIGPLFVNLVTIVPLFVIVYLLAGTVLPFCYPGFALIAIVNLLMLPILAEQLKDTDTLNFDVTLSGEGPDERKARFLELVGTAERHLSQNRVSVRKVGPARRWLDPLAPPETTFELPGMGMRLRAFSVRPAGPLAAARFAIGPVPDGSDPVARRVLEGLRQELLRVEEKDAPEKKA